jgi:hypothetical protein
VPEVIPVEEELLPLVPEVIPVEEELLPLVPEVIPVEEELLPLVPELLPLEVEAPLQAPDAPSSEVEFLPLVLEPRGARRVVSERSGEDRTPSTRVGPAWETLSMALVVLDISSGRVSRKEGQVARKSEQLGSQLTVAISGLKNVLPKNVKSIKVGEEVVSVKVLVAKLEALSALWAEVEKLGAAYHDAVEVRDLKASEARKLLDDFRVAIKGVMGQRNLELRGFGIEPKKDRRGGRKQKPEAQAGGSGPTDAKPGK